MAIFFKLNDQVYKSGNKVIIGRGVPFENLNEDRDISRSHCKIFNKKGQFFIKRLDEKARVLVNNKSVPVGKKIPFKITDFVLIDKYPLDILSKYEGNDYILINRFYSPFAQKSKIGFIKLFALLTVFFTVVLTLIDFNLKSSLLTNLFNSFLPSVLISFLFSAMNFFGQKLMGRNDELFVNEVLIGGEGLTIHYRKTNMSIRYENIEHIYKEHDIVMIHAHDEVFSLNTVKNLDKLFDKVVKKVPESARNTKPQNKEDTKLIVTIINMVSGVYIIGICYFYLFVESWAQVQILSLMLIPLGFFTLIVGRSFIGQLSKGANSKNAFAAKKQEVVIAILFIIGGYSSYTDYKSISFTEKKYNECIKGNKFSCKEVSYKKIQEIFEGEPKKFEKHIAKLCVVNKDFCKVSSRSIASEEELED